MFLLTPLSLPQRLLFCIFNPLLLFSLFLILNVLYIFDVYQTGSQTVSLYKRDTASLTGSGAADYLHSVYKNYTVNEQVLEKVINQYTQDTIDLNYKFVNRYVQEIWQENLAAQLDDWKNATEIELSLKNSSLVQLNNLNETIYLQLYQNAQSINDTFDILANKSLLFESNGQSDYYRDLQKNLTLNYWFLNSIFANVSEDLDSIASLQNLLVLPVMKNVTVESQWSYQNYSKINELKSQIITLINDSKSDSHTLKKRTVTSKLKTVETTNTIKISGYVALFVILFVLGTAYNCVIEYFKFKAEKKIFNETYTVLDSNKERLDVNAQIESRKNMLELIHTLKNVITYYILKLAPATSTSKEKSIKFQVLHQWIIKNGSSLWFIFFNALIFWSLIFKLTTITTLQSAHSHGKSLSQQIFANFNDSQSSLVNTTQEFNLSIESSLLNNIHSLCSNFTKNLELTVTSTTTNQLWNQENGTLTNYLNDTQSSMKLLIESLSHSNLIQIPEWNYQNDTELLWNQVQAQNLASLVIEKAINGTLTDKLYIKNLGTQTSTPTTTTATVTVTASAMSPQQQSSVTSSFPKTKLILVRKWSLISIVIVILVHHIFGSIAVLRL